MSEYKLHIGLGSHEGGSKVYNFYGLTRGDESILWVAQYGKVSSAGRAVKVTNFAKKLQEKRSKGYRFDNYSIDLGPELEGTLRGYCRDAGSTLPSKCASRMTLDGDLACTQDPETVALAYLHLADSIGQCPGELTDRIYGKVAERLAVPTDRDLSDSYGESWGAFS